jgi:hypothetical protein
VRAVAAGSVEKASAPFICKRVLNGQSVAAGSVQLEALWLSQPLNRPRASLCISCPGFPSLAWFRFHDAVDAPREPLARCALPLCRTFFSIERCTMQGPTRRPSTAVTIMARTPSRDSRHNPP